MALVVGTDSYVTVDEADLYFESRPYSTGWLEADDDLKEQSLRMAALHLDMRYEWKGSVSVAGQSLEWPRDGVLDQRGEDVLSTTVPTKIKMAQMELALQWTGGDQLTPPGSFMTSADASSLRSLKREKLGPLEREYFQNQSYLWSMAEGALNMKVYPFIDMLVAAFIYGRPTSIFKRIILV